MNKESLYKVENINNKTEYIMGINLINWVIEKHLSYDINIEEESYNKPNLEAYIYNWLIENKIEFTEFIHEDNMHRITYILKNSDKTYLFLSDINDKYIKNLNLTQEIFETIATHSYGLEYRFFMDILEYHQKKDGLDLNSVVLDLNHENIFFKNGKLFRTLFIENQYITKVYEYNTFDKIIKQIQ